MVIRVTNLSRELPKHGWRITALAGKKRHYWCYEPDILKTLPKEVEIVKAFSPDPSFFLKERLLPYPRHLSSTKLPAPALYSRLMRWLAYTFMFPDHFIGWIPFAYRKAVKLIKENNFDAMFSTSVPETNHIVAMLLKKKFPNLPWVADFRDFFVNRQFVTFTNPLMDKAAYYLERKFISYADQVWGVTPGLVKELKDRYKKTEPEDKFICLTNGYSKWEMETFSSLPVNIRKTPDEFIIAHTGNLLNTRRIEPFLEVWKKLMSRENKRPVRLVLLGEVDLLTQEYIKANNLQDSISIVSRVPHDYSLRLQREADMLFHIISPSPRAKSALSTKISEYLYWRKPTLVLAPDDSDTARAFRKARVGKVFPLENQASCYDYLVETIENPSIEPSGIPEEIEKYSWEQLGMRADEYLCRLIIPEKNRKKHKRT